MPDEKLLGPPPAAVLSMFRKMGLVEVDLGVPGAQPWWKAPGGAPMPWPEVLDAVVTDLQRLRATVAVVPASAKKPFWKTSEFWLAVAGTSAAAGTGITQLASDAASLPPPWNTVVGVVCSLMGLMLPVGYAFARTLAKETAAREVPVHDQEPTTDPDQKAPQ